MKPIMRNSLIIIFSLTYSAMLVRRSALEIWSLSKYQIENDLSISSMILGIYDTAYLLSYAIGEWINGMLCDRIGETLIVSLGLGTAGVGLIAVSFM